jgi:hypothetical protein
MALSGLLTACRVRDHGSNSRELGSKGHFTYLVGVRTPGPLLWIRYIVRRGYRVDLLTTRPLGFIIKQTHKSTWLCDEPRQRWVVIKPHGSQSLRCGQAPQANGNGTAPCRRIAVRVIFALEYHCVFLRWSLLGSIFSNVSGLGAVRSLTRDWMEWSPRTTQGALRGGVLMRCRLCEQDARLIQKTKQQDSGGDIAHHADSVSG